MNRYEELQRRYPGFATAWLIRGDKGDGERSIVPFVELWNNKNGLDEFAAIDCCIDVDQPFHMRKEMRRIRDAYWRYREKVHARKRNTEPLINERKFRVTRWLALPDGRLQLHAQLAEYKDFLVTNHFVANMDHMALDEIEHDGETQLANRIRSAFSPAGAFSPRSVLCQDEDAAALTRSALCSNHLGVSLMLVADVPEGNGRSIPVLLCPPSRGQISSPNDLIMAASGSVDWPLRPNAKDVGDVLSAAALRRNPSRLRIPAQIWREFGEECRHSQEAERDLASLPIGLRFAKKFDYGLRERRRYIRRAELINFCQNIERGGKPELFYLASVKGSGRRFIEETLRFNWEMETVYSLRITANVEHAKGQRIMMLLRSPVDVNLNLIRQPLTALRQIFEVLLDGSFNPVLRAHLAAVVRFCETRYPRRMRRVLADLRREFRFEIGRAAV